MITDKLQQLQTIKDNIKTAINNKGGNVGDDFTTYATAIDNIEGGGGGTGDCTLESITITENGKYYPNEGIDGYNEVVVNVTTPTDVYMVTDGVKFKTSTFTTIPEGLDFSNVTDFTETFMDCVNLKSVNINTSNAIKFESTFENCTNLETIGELDCSKVETVIGAFGECINLQNLGGFKDLGKSVNANRYILRFNRSNGLTRESMLNVFNKLYPIENIFFVTARIDITDIVKNALSDEDIAIATSKNWVIEVV